MEVRKEIRVFQRCINMTNNVYVYYYNNESELINSIQENNYIKDLYIGKTYNEYKIKSNNVNDTTILIYKEIKIVAVVCEKYKDILKLNIINNLNKVNLLDKVIFNIIFKSKYFKNLCKIDIDLDEIDDDVETISFTGNQLLESSILQGFNIVDIDSEIKLRSYAFQPHGYRYLMEIKSINRIDFNKRFSYLDIKKIVIGLIEIVGEAYGKYNE